MTVMEVCSQCNSQIRIIQYTNSYKLSLCQPHSQGLSSTHPPGVREERLWHRLVMCYFDNREHQGGVLSNHAICHVELGGIQSTGIIPHYMRCLKTILNSIYSNIYLKIKLACLACQFK